MPTNRLKGESDADLVRTLREAATRDLTPQEQLEQKVSFIYGALLSEDAGAQMGITKEHIRYSLSSN